MTSSQDVPLHSTDNFEIIIGVGEHKSGGFTGRDCYLLRNKRTGMIEAEGAVESAMIRAMHWSEAQLAEALSNPGIDDMDEFMQHLLARHSGDDTTPH